MDKDKEKKYKMAVIGPYDVISLFKAFGIDCFNVSTQEEAVETIEEIKKDKEKNYAVIFVPEELLKGMDTKTYKRISDSNFPTITSIPLIEADSGSSVEKIRRLAERAIGSDILK
ncbi:MAG: V-type ATP synthase subunit F [Patescibacteria group bacterium]